VHGGDAAVVLGDLAQRQVVSHRVSQWVPWADGMQWLTARSTERSAPCPSATAPRSGAIPHQRQRRAVDPAAVPLALGVLKRHHIDAVVDEALGGAVAVV